MIKRTWYCYIDFDKSCYKLGNKRWKAAHGHYLMCVTGYCMSNIFSHVFFKIFKRKRTTYDISLHLLLVCINKFMYLFLKCKKTNLLFVHIIKKSSLKWYSRCNIKLWKIKPVILLDYFNSDLNILRRNL